MKRHSSRYLVVILVTVLFAPAASGALMAPPQDNTEYRIRKVTIKHKLAEDSEMDPWRRGAAPKAVLLKFDITFEANANVPEKISLRVELRRLCKLKDPGGNVLTNRFQNFFTYNQEDVTVANDKTTDIKVKVHDTGWPPPIVCQFPNSDADHLGEGPYEALITPGPPSALASETSLKTTTTTQPLLVHSRYFDTCVFACRGGAVLKNAASALIGKKKGRK